MSGISNISSHTIALTSERPRGYRDAQDVRNRAAVAVPNETPQEQRALSRLSNTVNNETPPRTDVPRGYYLDIKV